jgi:hypothetical protein
MKKYKVLDGLGSDTYDNLHKLRKYRNKIHIQDDVAIEDVPRDEGEVFTEAVCSWAVALNRQVLKHLSEEFSRPTELKGFVGDLSIPSF